MTVPESGKSDGISVAGVWVRFSTEPRSIRIEFEGLTTRQTERGWVSVNALVQRDRFVTRSTQREWNNLRIEGTTRTLDLATAAEHHPLTGAMWLGGAQVHHIAVRRWPAATLDRLEVVVSLPGTTETLELKLASPLSLDSIWDQVLQQANTEGPAFLEYEHTSKKLLPSIVVLGKDLHGDVIPGATALSDATVLGFPTPQTRLLSIGNWLLIEHIDSTAPVNVVFDEIAAALRLERAYWVETVAQRIEVGRAAVLYVVGDFSGCFGASCGDPVDLRLLEVRWSEGRFAQKALGPCDTEAAASHGPARKVDEVVACDEAIARWKTAH